MTGSPGQGGGGGGHTVSCVWRVETFIPLPQHTEGAKCSRLLRSVASVLNNVYFLIILCVCVYTCVLRTCGLIHVSVCMSHGVGVCGIHKRVLDSLEVEIQGAVSHLT